MEKLGGTIGYLIGSIIIVPLVFTLIDRQGINRNDFSPYKNRYLIDTIDMVLKLSDYEQDTLSDHVSTTHGFTTKMSAVGGRDVSTRSRMYYRKTKDNKTGKFFLINVVDGDRLVFSAIDNNRFLASVNADDLNDENLGGIDNPIPVFSVRGIDKPLENYNRKGDIVQLDISEEQYRYSAEMYWTYVATKEEFERRFGKQK